MTAEIEKVFIVLYKNLASQESHYANAENDNILGDEPLIWNTATSQTDNIKHVDDRIIRHVIKDIDIKYVVCLYGYLPKQ